MISTIVSAIRQAEPTADIEHSLPSICQFITSSANSNTTLTVSHILEHHNNKRKKLIGHLSQFLGINKFTSKLLFKWDPAYKNFQTYLPTTTNSFSFLLLCLTKHDVIFGVASKGIGRHSKAILFNPDYKEVFPSA